MRYENLVCEIDIIHPRRILEIGTCKGERAELMIRAALKHHSSVEYIGFDLFEAPPEEEFSARKQPWSLDQVAERLAGLGAEVRLIKGDTRKTLPAFNLSGIELAFIDGGHSDETVRSDFEVVLDCIVPEASIMLDDYWNFPEGGGCKALVDSLDRDEFQVDHLDPIDEFKKPWGVLKTQIVRVILL